MAASASGDVWSKNLIKTPDITFVNVETFIKINSQTPKASDHRGFTLFDGGYVHKYEVQYAKNANIRAVCFRSQSKTGDPHKVEVSLASDPVKLVEWHCTCKAGKGFCQHVIALLYQTANYKKKGCKVVPPELSRTSTTQSWGVPKRSEGFHARPLQEVEVHKIKKEKPTEEKQTKRKFHDGIRSTLYNPVTIPLMDLDISGKLQPFLQTIDPRPQTLDLLESEACNFEESRFGLVPFGCTLAAQQPERQDAGHVTIPNFELKDLPLYGKEDLDANQILFFDGMKLPKSECEEIEQMTRNQSDCTKWHEVRKNRLTASKIHRISARRGNFPSLAEQLLRPVRQTEAMRQGIEKEPQAAESYSEELGLTTYPVGFVINPSAPHMGCSPDRRVYDPNEENVWGLLEIKCPQANSYDGVDFLKVDKTGRLKAKVNHQYYTQIMVQMGVTGCTWCDLYVLCQVNYHWERIYFSESKFNEIKEKVDRYFFKYFLPHVMQF